MSAPGTTPGPWFAQFHPVLAVVASEGHPVIAELTAVSDKVDCGKEVVANAHLLAGAQSLYLLVLQYRNDLIYPPEADSRERRLAAIDAALSAITPECSLCDGEGNIWNNADPTSGQRIDCECIIAPQRRTSYHDVCDALAQLSDLFALDGENSLDRFERLAAMFRKDTGYLAPGKDQPMGGADQPDGDELRAIYDGWYQAKVDRARAALAKAVPASPEPRA